jgi:hypothetical protein
MQLHREKGTIETPSVSEPFEAETAVTPPAAEIPPSQPVAEMPSVAPESTQEADRTSHRLDQIMRMHREKGTIESEPGLESVKPAQAETGIPDIQKTETAATSPADTEPGQNKTVVGETAVSSTAPPQPEIPPASPLQSVWPVQIIEQPKQTPPAQPAAATPIMRQTAPAADPNLHEQLKNIPLEQATDSSVQFIRPRKPRPQPAAPPTQTVQREKAHNSKQPDTKKATHAPDLMTSEATVATEIGELPSDLWRLIGAQPPTSFKQEASTPPAPTAAETINEDTKPTAQPVMQPERMPPTFIQRAESEEAAADLAPSLEAPAAPSKEGNETGQEEEVNMDELARQVYSDIKERMTIEWERTRGCF